MSYKHLLLVTVSGAVLLGGAVAAHDQDRGKFFKNRIEAELKPTEEVPALSSVASGSFKATIDEGAQTITYEVSYAGLEGDVLQSHIHVGQRKVNGGISVFLCGNPPTVPPATVPQPPACPASPATVTGVITPANIIGPAAQGIAPSTATANEFNELVDALREGITYANVHSSKFQGGEIRGQVHLTFGRR
jgi:hypothetical protein